MSNPFIYGGRVENPDDFVGRKTELRAIFSALETFKNGQAQHISVVGERRIGKSSLLHFITKTYPQHLSQPDSYRFAFTDLENANNHSLSELLNFILRKFNVSTKHDLSLSEFTEAIEMLRDKKRICPVICLDEFEQLVIRKNEFSDLVFDAFRSLGSNNKVAFLTASKTPLSDLINQNNMTSTFPNIFMQKTLKAFSSAEALQLLERGSPLFSQDDKDRILIMSDCKPGKLQRIAHKAYSMKEDGVITWEEIKRECEYQPEHASPNQLKNTRTNKLTEFFRIIFIVIPRELGRSFLEFRYKDKDKVGNLPSLFWGYFILLIFLIGILFFEQLIHIVSQITTALSGQ